MDEWALVDAYAQFHPRWFESPGHYSPSAELLDVYREEPSTGWTVKRQGLWYVAQPPGHTLREQGWKLHVSVRAEDSPICLRRAARAFRQSGTAFKFLVDRRTVASANGKNWARSSGGKFIAAYPASDQEFLRLGEQLARELGDLEGPYILSDRRWPESNCVFYRYGGFQALPILQVDGSHTMGLRDPGGKLVPDDRSPFWNPPPWVIDPVADGRGLPVDDRRPELAGGRFTVTSALRFSNRGGVYKGVDLHTGRDVVIKEARPHIVVGRHQIDAISCLEKEHRILSILAHTGSFVRPISLFRQDSHAFMVEEFLPGSHLGIYTILNNPLYRGGLTAARLERYLADIKQVWIQVARAVRHAHHHGIYLGDLSFTNVIVSESLDATVVDLECSVEDGVDPQVGLHTPGMASPHTQETGNVDKHDDYYGIGALISGSIMLTNGISELHAPARERFMGELRSDLALPDSLIGLVHELMAPPAIQSIPDVTSMVEDVSLRLGNATAARPRLAEPIQDRIRDDGQVDIRIRVAAARDGVITYLMSTADIERSDRLSPGHLAVFETNPLSVSYGAAGVVYALHRLTGEVPPPLEDWLLDHLSAHPSMGADLPPGLYVGQSGVAWVLHVLGRTETALGLMRQARTHPLLWMSPNVMWGAAGYGLACLHFWTSGLGEEFLDEATRVGEFLSKTAIHTRRGDHWVDADGGAPVGYGYGGSGISMFLLGLAQALNDPGTLRAAQRALDHDLNAAIIRDGLLVGFPEVAVDDDAETMTARCYWDAGTAGVATCVARHLAFCPDERLLAWVDPLVFDLSHKYTVFPQLFHGLAGLGNALLDIWEVSHDDRHLQTAWQAAEGILLFRIETPEGVGFPGEQCIRESADFATGAAGVGLFLDRLLATDTDRHDNFNFVVDVLMRQERPRDK